MTGGFFPRFASSFAIAALDFTKACYFKHPFAKSMKGFWTLKQDSKSHTKLASASARAFIGRRACTEAIRPSASDGAV